MASMGGGYLDPAPLIRTIRSGGYINRILQQICSGEGLNKVGVKADLQARIIERIQQHASSNNVARFNRLKRMIEDPGSIDPSSPYRGGMASSSSSAHTPSTPRTFLGASSSQGGTAFNGGGSANGYRAHGQPRIEFSPSPYYVIEEQLGDPAPCEVMTHHRHTVKIPLKVNDHPILSRVTSDPTLRVLVFCAAEGHGRQDITFPHQSEIKVNGGDIKANLRGLKNKPGSTRPVDITKELRLNIPAYSNTVEMTYALTSKAGAGSQKFYLVIFVVKAIPVTDLVKRLENGKRITEQTIIDQMVNKARDADIVTTSSVLSLKCPLSTLRIDLPVRSISCRHNQCFDATSYLQLQEQGPTWLCPICSNSAPFEGLAVDEYVKGILKNTSKSVDQVIVQPDGKWEVNSRKENSSSQGQNGFGSESDDDLIEITKPGGSVRMGTPHMKTPVGAYNSLSREQSTSSVPRIGSTSGKRPAPTVIDLTSSGDEDEEPLVRPTKRQNTTNGYGTPSSLPVYRPAHQNGYQP